VESIYLHGERQGRAILPAKRAIAAATFLKTCTAIVLSLLASCAQLPAVSAVDFPPVPPGDARIWFYRVYDPTESKGRPHIYMNGRIVGISDQSYTFYVLIVPPTNAQAEISHYPFLAAAEP